MEKMVCFVFLRRTALLWDSPARKERGKEMGGGKNGEGKGTKTAIHRLPQNSIIPVRRKTRAGNYNDQFKFY
ncbi:hypothetical protein GQ457_06G024530 [Hibiscus cannabinus]